MCAGMTRHDVILRHAVAEAGGQVFENLGDGLCAVFVDVPAALRAAQAGQAALQTGDFVAIGQMRVRMAVHVGAAEARDHDYFGPPLSRIARLLAADHGGQILFSAAAGEQAGLNLLKSTLRDLGLHRLKILAAPAWVFQLLAPGLSAEFPAVRTLDSLPNNPPQQPTSLIGRIEELGALGQVIAQNRLVTLMGSGGLGKTQLFLQLGADRLGQFAHASGANRRCGRAWAHKPRHDQCLILTYLQYQRLMLILGNCEHLIEGAAALADAILTTCPHVMIVA